MYVWSSHTRALLSRWPSFAIVPSFPTQTTRWGRPRPPCCPFTPGSPLSLLMCAPLPLQTRPAEAGEGGATREALGEVQHDT